MRSEDRAVVLAICTVDRRLWVYDGETGMNRPVPVTNFYNELMLHLNVRDPKVALDSLRLFQDLSGFTDGDLTRAFARSPSDPDKSERQLPHYGSSATKGLFVEADVSVIREQTGLRT